MTFATVPHCLFFCCDELEPVDELNLLLSSVNIVDTSLHVVRSRSSVLTDVMIDRYSNMFDNEAIGKGPFMDLDIIESVDANLKNWPFSIEM